eukprot:753884-Hanusia_phi.AAC.7
MEQENSISALERKATCANGGVDRHERNPVSGCCEEIKPECKVSFTAKMPNAVHVLSAHAPPQPVSRLMMSI